MFNFRRINLFRKSRKPALLALLRRSDLAFKLFKPLA